MPRASESIERKTTPDPGDVKIRARELSRELYGKAVNEYYSLRDLWRLAGYNARPAFLKNKKRYFTRKEARRILVLLMQARGEAEVPELRKL